MNLLLKNNARLSSPLTLSTGLTLRYVSIASKQALFRCTERSLLPLPITDRVSPLICSKLIPTSSERRKPQFKKRVIMAKSLSLNSPSTEWSRATDSSRFKYFGNLFSNFGASSPEVGFLSIFLVISHKYL